MPQTYSITAPNGKTLEITGDHVPSEAELKDIFVKAGVDAGVGPKGGTETDDPTRAKLNSWVKTYADTGKAAWDTVTAPLYPSTWWNAMQAKTAAEQQAGKDAATPQSYSLGNVPTNVGHRVDDMAHAVAALATPEGGGAAIGAFAMMLAGARTPQAKAALLKRLEGGRAVVGPFVEAAIKKTMGGDPEAINLAATKMKLEAARSTTRQAITARKMGEASAVPKPAVDPTALPSPALAAGVERYGASRSGYVPGEIIPPQGPLPISSLTDWFERYGPSRSGYQAGEVIPPQGPLPTSSLADVDPRMPNVSGYQAGEVIPPQGPLPTSSLAAVDRYAPSQSGYVAGEAHPPQGSLPTSSAVDLDRYAPSGSGYVAGEAANTTSQAASGLSIPQATWAPNSELLKDGSRPIIGTGLKVGDVVNVINRQGSPSLQTVDKILRTKDGIVLASVKK